MDTVAIRLTTPIEDGINKIQPIIAPWYPIDRECLWYNTAGIKDHAVGLYPQAFASKIRPSSTRYLGCGIQRYQQKAQHQRYPSQIIQQQ